LIFIQIYQWLASDTPPTRKPTPQSNSHLI
jgi:hypothetical protein